MIASFVALAISFGPAAAEAPPQATAAMLEHLQEQLDEQTKRIDRIYRLIGPNLAELEERAAAIEKQQAKDKPLALETIRELADEDLGSIGCINPAAAFWGSHQ